MTSDKFKILLASNGTVVVLLVLVTTLTFLSPRFLQPSNLETVVLSMAEIGIIAIPMTFLVMSGSVDLSVGSIASLAAVSGGIVSSTTGNLLLGTLVALAVGVIAGVINGMLVEMAGLNPLVVTLGTLSVWGGLALLIAEGRSITDLPSATKTISSFQLFGVISTPMLVLIAVFSVGWWILNRKPFGRAVLATGGNARAAFLMGINVKWVRIRLFVFTGIAASVAGTLMSWKLQAASPSLGNGLEFSVLTVVLLGGIAFEGGQGRLSGVLAGVLFVGALRNGLVILGVSQFVQTIMVGLTLIAAVSFDKSIQRVLKSAWVNVAKQEDDPSTTPPPGNATATATERTSA
ncbi:ABC transporter permease [Demequina oxidasica]|uniref:ABC transporter permease n=1 Tax=Demequina oxidasica TaxID=676199 RepID=UPI0009FEC232|nr:ABC transporter permease [Demequina oxidasica]